jgi:hypothetical protein
MGLVLLLMQFQIDAVCRLHERLDQWWLSDAALKRLRFLSYSGVPSFECYSSPANQKSLQVLNFSCSGEMLTWPIR